ncbi:hypothetical protein Bpfe_017686 [Biomphalaria pfeifferi]|uniref:Uncharacterized protein n=1 Tax=Biomphalaria pfeifferi TaxID=112525 RepID=A0AAD8F5T9_BIOPF|nr:hypothetical protein Bpfe_017686 [Biomphalaria pfeifferi]
MLCFLGVFSDIRDFKGSGGGWRDDSLTLPLEQHMPGFLPSILMHHNVYIEHSSSLSVLLDALSNHKGGCN